MRRFVCCVALLFLATSVAPAATRPLMSEPSWARRISPPLARTTPALDAGYVTRRRHAPVSAVMLRAFLLQPSGILFGMHPTEARIVITATAAAPLRVCQLGTTFSAYWKGGCRRLGGRPLALPTSGGAVHIGFRVLPSDGRKTRVAALRVRWHCVDHYFSLLRGTTKIGSASPAFDC